MASSNPYESPQTASSGTGPRPALLLWNVGTVFGCAILGGLTGLGIGAALGWLLPGYYRSTFSAGSDPYFDPLAVGIGQGLTQGTAFGGVVGLALVALFYWHRTFGPDGAGGDDEQDSAT